MNEKRSKLLPPAVAAMAITEKLIRSDMHASTFALLELQVQLIAQLHVRGAIDGHALAAAVQRNLLDPQVLSINPGIGSLAEFVTGRLLGALHTAEPKEHEPPQG